ncbi:MAG: preprotein translocase subunit YajC [Rickettsiales bacterium]|jgi:preprotein translocase subunit YajC|nr:preprotein translocase subunit YajC [Rickettsiales bacterium]
MENVTTGVAQSVPAGNSVFGMLLWCAIILAFMYFIMLRPNKKRMEEYKKMLDSLKVGNKIIFAGGIYGVIKSISDTTMKVEIADGVVVEIPKSAVANIA